MKHLKWKLITSFFLTVFMFTSTITIYASDVDNHDVVTEIDKYGLKQTKATNGNTVELEFNSISKLLYQSRVNIKTDQHASISFNFNESSSVAGGLHFACATGYLTFTIKVDEGYMLSTPEMSVGNMTKHGVISDFIRYEELGKNTYKVYTEHPAASLIDGFPGLSSQKHYHGTTTNSLLSIRGTFLTKRDMNSYVWKDVAFYQTDNDLITTLYGNELGETISISTIRPVYNEDLEFLGYTTDKDLVAGDENIINDYATYLKIKNNFYTNTYTLPSNYQDKVISLYGVYGTKEMMQNALTLSINHDFGEGEAHTAADILPDNKILKGYAEGASYGEESGKVDGFVAIPLVVEGTFLNDHIIRTVLYYVDENNNEIADKDEERYAVEVSFQYALGEVGDVANLPQPLTINNLLTKQPYLLTIPKLEGYVADQLEVKGTILDTDIKEVVTYYEDKNNNEIPDRDEDLLVVTFNDYNGDLIARELVLPGMNAKVPENPTRAGYSFTGWDGNYQAVKVDETVIATYLQNPIIPILPVIPTPPTTPAIPGPVTPVALVAPVVIPVTPPAAPTPPAETVIPDATPLADGTETVKEKETPKAKGVEGGNDWALFNLIATILTALLGVITVLNKKKDSNTSERHSFIGKITASVLALASIALFIFTQDVTQTMTFIDQWSFVMMAIAVIQIATLVIVKKGLMTSDKQVSIKN